MKHNRQQAGQTLIETMVAVFIMVMGITAALGLASYSLNISSGIVKQITAIGLAREGLEAIKSARDTNWLRGVLNSDCYDFSSGTYIGACYRDWLNEDTGGTGTGYNIDPQGGTDSIFKVDFSAVDDSTDQSIFWRIVSSPVGSNTYNLNYNSSGGQFGFYTHEPIGSAKNSGFNRQVYIDDSSSSSAPFNTDVGPRILVSSRVWWSDTKCPASTNWPGVGKCAIELNMYLTNWKTY